MTTQQHAAAELMHRWGLWRSDLGIAASSLDVEPLTDTEWAAIRSSP